MKKLFLSLFVAGALTFGLQSCGEDDPCDTTVCDSGEICDDGNCIPDPSAVCDVCGSYTGTLNGNVNIPGTTVPPLTNVASTVTVVKVTTEDYRLTLDLSSLGLAGLAPNPVGSYNATTNTILFADAPYTYDPTGLNLQFLINGTAIFDGSGNVDVNVALSGASQATGNLVVEASK